MPIEGTLKYDYHIVKCIFSAQDTKPNFTAQGNYSFTIYHGQTQTDYIGEAQLAFSAQTCKSA